MLGPPADIEPSVRQSMVDAFAYSPEGPIEAAWYAVRYGELLAWLGFHERAAEVLERGVPLPDPTHYGQVGRPLFTASVAVSSVASANGSRQPAARHFRRRPRTRRTTR